MTIPVTSVYQQFKGLNGLPLENGYVYIGAANENPETSPISVYYDEDATQPAAQPLRTINGFIHRSGTPCNIFVNSNYSQTVRDSSRSLVSTTLSAASAGDWFALLISSIGSSLIGFIQAGVGAVLNTVQGKLQETISVADFLSAAERTDATSGTTPTLTMNTSVSKWIDACASRGKAGLIPINYNIRINAPLDTLTANDIRIYSPVNCFNDQAASTNLPTITLDNTALLGSFNSGTNTLTFTSQLKQLEGVVIKALNGAAYGAFINGSFCTVDRTHFEGFANCGIWDIGSTICTFKASFYNCGEGRTTSGALNADTFIDGCAMMSTGSTSPAASGAANNASYCRVFSSANFGGSKTIDILVTNTGTTTTSLKGFIGFNTRDTVLRVRGYQGIWLAYCDVVLDAPHCEVYATGGAVAADGWPLALVTLNCSPRVNDPFFVCSGGLSATFTGSISGTTLTVSAVVGTIVIGQAVGPAIPNTFITAGSGLSWTVNQSQTSSPTGSYFNPVRQYRTTAFTTALDYWGFHYSNNNSDIFSRSQSVEEIWGQYKPDNLSYSITHLPALGTLNNPISYYDPSWYAKLASAGAKWLPTQQGLPFITSGTIATGANVDLTSATAFPAFNINTQYEGSYNVYIYVYDNVTGLFYYDGDWVATRQVTAGNDLIRFYAKGAVNANGGGITVTENGAGPYTLRIANGVAVITVTYIVQAYLRMAQVPTY